MQPPLNAADIRDRLVKKNRHEQAITALAHVRCEPIDSPEIIKEMAEIRAQIEEELNATEGVTWKEALRHGNRYVHLVLDTHKQSYVLRRFSANSFSKQ